VGARIGDDEKSRCGERTASRSSAAALPNVPEADNIL
jgi:hypothetical protein